MAEVLITLGIIGVVAALTMPILTQKIQDKQLESQRKKALNVVTNGFKKMMANQDVTNFVDLKVIDRSCSDEECFFTELKKVFQMTKYGFPDTYANNNFAELPKQYVVEDGLGNVISSFMYSVGFPLTFYTTDGMVYCVDPAPPDEGLYHVYIDVNGSKNPNTLGKDYMILKAERNGKIINIEDTFINGSQSCKNNLRACQTQQSCESQGGTWVPNVYVGGDCYKAN